MSLSSTKGTSAAPRTAVVVNTRSGGRRSALFVLSKMQQVFGVASVYELFAPQQAHHLRTLDTFLVAARPEIVIVAGGDGSISYVMDAVKALHDRGQLSPRLGRIAPFPLGTGNDFCCSLGFGSGFAMWVVLGSHRFRKALRTYDACESIPVDRWQLRVRRASAGSLENSPVRGGRGSPSLSGSASSLSSAGGHDERYLVNNYFSIGFDAAIAGRLDAFRQRHPRLFITRPVVKLWYAAFAVAGFFTEGRVSGGMRVYVNGAEVAVPPGTKALVVANMLTYAGGATLWDPEGNGGGSLTHPHGLAGPPAADPHAAAAALALPLTRREAFVRPSVRDGVLEVVALAGVPHLSAVRLGLAYGTRLAQGTEVRVVCPDGRPAQYDGQLIEGPRRGGGGGGGGGAGRSVEYCISYYCSAEVVRALPTPSRVPRWLRRAAKVVVSLVAVAAAVMAAPLPARGPFFHHNKQSKTL